jgi:hypothetical protein
MSFLSNNHDTRPDSKIVSQPQKISYATKREGVILSCSRYERRAKERFMCLRDNEFRVNQEAGQMCHHSR